MSEKLRVLKPVEMLQRFKTLAEWGAAVKGAAAQAVGAPLTDCPYKDSQLREAWQLGYLKSENNAMKGGNLK